jgi:hypothetical protein
MKSDSRGCRKEPNTYLFFLLLPLRGGYFFGGSLAHVRKSDRKELGEEYFSGGENRGKLEEITAYPTTTL